MRGGREEGRRRERNGVQGRGGSRSEGGKERRWREDEGREKGEKMLGGSETGSEAGGHWLRISLAQKHSNKFTENLIG